MLSNRIMIVLAALVVASQVGSAYWIVTTIRSSVPSDYATSADLEQLGGVQNSLEHIKVNTDDLQDALDELAPRQALKRMNQKMQSYAH